MNVLARHNSDAWVDFPLSAGAASTGKLSCDLALPIELCHNTVARIAPPLRDAVLRFAGLVQVAAARLDVLYRQELQTSVPRQTDVGEMILQECDTPDALYRFCADRLPTLLQCRYGSILTRVRDSCGSDLLIFQRTSYVGSKHLQGVGTYHLEENTLTTWVARTGRSICLQDLGDRSLLQDKLREYDPNLKWANKIPDSDNHGDLLIVPVWYKQDVIAVLRYTARHDGHFTEREQRWLEQIARRHIGPRLDCTRRRLSEALRVAHYEEIAANSVRDAVTENDTGKEIAELFGATARKIFTQSGSGKTVLVNVIDEDRIHFRHYAILDELAGERLERYELAGSLTSMALSRPGVVYLADLEHAATMACYRSVFRDAVCALACKMGPAAQPTGVIVVLSDRFDISEDEHGPVLNLLAEHAGEILWRRELKSTLLKNWSRASGLKAVVRHLDQLLCKRESYTETAVPQLRPLLSLLNRMLDAVVPDGHKTESFTEEFDEFRVRDAIIVAASLARSETSESNLECHVDPDLNVVAQQGFFVAVMFDLLRYAWRFSRTAFIRARRRRSDGGAQWLEICIESFGKSRRIPAISGHSEAVLQSLRLEPRILELRGPYELARSYRLPDGRSGDVRVDTNEHDACYRCTFQLPIGADIPKPSMS
ncbi:MAG: GAF domain-containing protein [Pirellulales bacterium]